MTCPRCEGLMLPERADDSGMDAVWLCGCINCGDRLDGVILAHRLLRPAADRIANLHKAPMVMG